MKVAFDVSPLSSGHKIRGVGFYVSHLLEALEQSNKVTVFPFETNAQIPDDSDLVHFPYFDPFTSHTAYPLTYPFVVTIHDVVPLLYPDKFPPGIKGSFRLRNNKKKITKAKAVITDSETSKRDIHRCLNIDLAEIHSVYLAPSEEFAPKSVPSKRRNSLRAKYRLPEKFCLYVGDVTANKNLPFLLRTCAFAQIPLVLVGKSLTDEAIDITNAWNRDAVLARYLIAQHENLYALGFVPTDELVMLYNMAECLILPSEYEGFGLPLVEAMASSCPVICSDIPTFKEIAADAPMYFDPADESGLLQAISGIFAKQEVQKKHAEKGLAIVKKYSWAETARQTVRVYEEAISKR